MLGCHSCWTKLAQVLRATSKIVAMCCVDIPRLRPALGLICSEGTVGIWKLTPHWVPPEPEVHLAAEFKFNPVSKPEKARIVFSGPTELIAVAVEQHVKIWSIRDGE